MDSVVQLQFQVFGPFSVSYPSWALSGLSLSCSVFVFVFMFTVSVLVFVKNLDNSDKRRIPEFNIVDQTCYSIRFCIILQLKD